MYIVQISSIIQNIWYVFLAIMGRYRYTLMNKCNRYKYLALSFRHTNGRGFFYIPNIMFYTKTNKIKLRYEITTATRIWTRRNFLTTTPALIPLLLDKRPAKNRKVRNPERYEIIRLQTSRKWIHQHTVSKKIPCQCSDPSLEQK